jgi:3-oxoacyl-[acyl-carrier-protein] synthase III
MGQLADRSGLSGAHTHRVVERYGNLGSASVAVGLDDAVRSHVIHDSGLVLLAAFGGGMSVGATVLRWSTSV